MRTIFLGTPEFAVPTLRALVQTGHNVQAVFTQPDRPKGRGNQMAQSPVKQAAVELGLNVYQPERIRRPEQVDLVKTFETDVMVVVGYGQIIPQSIIDLPKHGILNVHASLLPKYRGAAPIQWAIANGETETGVTIMQIDAGLDTGDMLLKASLPIGPDQTAPELSAQLAPLGANLLLEALQQIAAGAIQREKQNDVEATLAPILTKEDGLIDWSRPARHIYNRLRGFTPWPGAYTTLRDQKLSVLKARPETSVKLPPAKLHTEKRRLFAGCGEDSVLELLEIQMEGKKRMPADVFLNGFKLADDEGLGDRN
jgi:methionyl-tRNA formyltransferase